MTIVLVVVLIQLIVQLVLLAILLAVAFDLKKTMRLHNLVCRAALVTGAGAMIGKIGGKAKKLDNLLSIFM